jgi:hypothetical protein
VWAVGAVGTALLTTDVGAQWVVQNPNTSYNLNAISVTNKSLGWVVGDFSTIRHTIDSGTTWTAQLTTSISRIVQRVYTEGNVGSLSFLVDNSIHPDTNIETSKRVQIQYRVRVEPNVDPIDFPEAGLGSTAIVGLGPNATGSFSFVSAGPTTGDYGLWQAQCPNTVDGYCWAIPMFFVNRRNSLPYDPTSNANGGSTDTQVRPDLLTATQVVAQDLLDVRRLNIVPDLTELLDRNFDALCGNRLRTHLYRNTAGGDSYGTEILQIDAVKNSPGDAISGATLASVVAGGISSEISVSDYSGIDLPATATIPSAWTPQPLAGSIFHFNPLYFSVVYVGGDHSGKIAPVSVIGLGTAQVTITFSPNVLNQATSPGLSAYRIKAKIITQSQSALKYIPSQPGIVENLSGSSQPPFYYHGILQNSPSTTIEQWDSGLTGTPNYVLAFPYNNADVNQMNRASPVELHYFIRITAAQLLNPSGTPKVSSTLIIPIQIPVVTPTYYYTIQTVSRILNKDSGYTYKIVDQRSVGVNLQITSAPGFQFLEGATVEIVAYVMSSVGAIRNGAAVNFDPVARGISSFCISKMASGAVVSPPSTHASVSLTGGNIFGISTSETVQGLTQPICWYNPGGTLGYGMVPITNITGWGTGSLTFDFADGSSRSSTDSSAVMLQASVLQTQLTYNNDSLGGDGLLIGYDYVPYQGIGNLPDSATVELLTKPTMISISNVGTGGGTPGSPYLDPIEHIPVNDSNLSSDSAFYNLEPLRFNNFSVDGGFVQLPIYVPADSGPEITLSVPVADYAGRSYYSVCSRNLAYYSEGLLAANPRKIFVAAIARVNSTSDFKLTLGEYVLLIVSHNEMTSGSMENKVETGAGSAIALYRLPNKPIAKV